MQVIIRARALSLFRGFGLKAGIVKELAEILVESLPRRCPELPLKEDPIEVTEVPAPRPDKGQVLIAVEACGVCYTDIDIVEGRVRCKLPLIPGHQVVGRVVEVGDEVLELASGDRVGVAWIAWTCGRCEQCARGLENLCSSFKATGCDVDGGYAEYVVANSGYAYKLPAGVEAERLAPLMCAGSIGWRAYKLAGVYDGARVGLFGFGSSAHIVIQVIKRLRPSAEIYVFSRSPEHRELAMRLGADWAGHPSESPPRKLNVAIDFTPVGETVSRALELLERGGRLVVNAIRKQTPIVLDYARHLWEEREVKSVANVARNDVKEFLEFCGKHNIEMHVQVYRLEGVNEALRDLKAARVRGAPVLKIR
jgi:propanol-preferring alcohol dehydrogenase